jgi:ubiquitin-conjugating enzyme E2 J2
MSASIANDIITEKRLRNELKDLKKNKIDVAQAIQDETNKFIFYFLLKGDPGSDYDGGIYLGKILLPDTYPSKPGDFMMLTPNGRFTINSKICLTNSGYHSDTWTPIWSIRNMILGFVSIFNSDVEHGISHIKDSPHARRNFAANSISYNMTHYKDIFTKFDQFVNSDGTLIKSLELSTDTEKVSKKKKKEKHVSTDIKVDVPLDIKVVDAPLDIKVEINEDIHKEVIEKKTIEDVVNDYMAKYVIDKNLPKLKKKADEPKLLSKTDLIRAELETIKKMTYEKLNYRSFEKIYALLTSSLSEL